VNRGNKEDIGQKKTKRGSKKGLTLVLKKDLNFLVTEFLEKTPRRLSREMKQKPQKAKQIYERLRRILFSIDSIQSLDLYSQVRKDLDFKGLVLLYHDWLKQTWDAIKLHIFIYKEANKVIMPNFLWMLDGMITAIEKLLRSKSFDAQNADTPESVEDFYIQIEEFIELSFSFPLNARMSENSKQNFLKKLASKRTRWTNPKFRLEQMERTRGKIKELIRSLPVYPLTAATSVKSMGDLKELSSILREIHAKSFLEQEEQLFMPALSGVYKDAKLPMVRLDFGYNRISFYDWHDPIKALLEIIDGLPIDIFRECPQCGRCFIETRKGKEYCNRLCAVKAGQRSRQEDMKTKKESDAGEKGSE
jgi:hypothetical protein